MYKLIFFVVMFFYICPILEIQNVGPGVTVLRLGCRRCFLSGKEKLTVSDDLIYEVRVDSGRICIKNLTGKKIKILQLVRTRMDSTSLPQAPVPNSVEGLGHKFNKRVCPILRATDSIEIDAPIEIMEINQSEVIPYPCFEDELDAVANPVEEHESVHFSVRNFSHEVIKVTCASHELEVDMGSFFDFVPDDTVLIHYRNSTHEIPEIQLLRQIKLNNCNLGEVRVYCLNGLIKFLAKKDCQEDWQEVYQISTKKDLILYQENNFLK